MISDVLKVAGNYAIYAATGGEILLDVGGTGTNHTGVVTINGNLNVLGVQTTIHSTDASISDNTLILNSGETNLSTTGGITLSDDFGNNTSGIKIDRGNAGNNSVAAFLLYDDRTTLTDGTTSTQGVWKFGASNEYGRTVEVDVITTRQPKLTLLGADNPNKTLSVKGTLNYAFNVTDPDDIPNKAYVDSALNLGTTVTQKVQVGDSYIELYDNAISSSSVYYSPINKAIVALGNKVVMLLEDSLAQVQALTIVNSTIAANTSSYTSINLVPQPGGNVRIESGLITKHTGAISSSTGYTAIYTSSTVGGGGTGVHFVSPTGKDEFVSRRRSIVYGIIF